MSNNLTTDTPRVWIGCLACYNAGRLIGEWFDADTAGDITPAQIHGHVTTHEELWVMDSDGFDGALTGECSPAEAQRIAEALTTMDDSYVPRAALLAWAANDGTYPVADVADWIGDAEDAWAGEHDDRETFAQDLADNLGVAPAGDAPWPLGYIDWERAARDLFLGGDYWDVDNPDGGLFVFRSI